ncbi:hypothetical protein DL1_19610 [Thioclava dalianensis]|uniref:Uncharacterized protein n=1 Tax=Thioclava dalianensis TaxID=1185766 RepID=A0A074TZH5_9RHOB|nr:hypothetical protein [Thioclava dalianensis]KEP67812.1 hypothetical protein DL1_19610 [Thioclava dalianensis]SFN48750.1 hypothetical protein SAMN05216224_10635 [Thioclava dalianensis]
MGEFWRIILGRQSKDATDEIEQASKSRDEEVRAVKKQTTHHVLAVQGRAEKLITELEAARRGRH